MNLEDSRSASHFRGALTFICGAAELRRAHLLGHQLVQLGVVPPKQAQALGHLGVQERPAGMSIPFN